MSKRVFGLMVIVFILVVMVMIEYYENEIFLNVFILKVISIYMIQNYKYQCLNLNILIFQVFYEMFINNNYICIFVFLKNILIDVCVIDVKVMDLFIGIYV